MAIACDKYKNLITVFADSNIIKDIQINNNYMYNNKQLLWNIFTFSMYKKVQIEGQII